MGWQCDVAFFDLKVVHNYVSFMDPVFKERHAAIRARQTTIGDSYEIRSMPAEE